MISLENAIKELNDPKARLNGTYTLTSGELIMFLQRLERFESLKMEPDDIRALMRSKESTPVYVMRNDEEPSTPDWQYVPGIGWDLAFKGRIYLSVTKTNMQHLPTEPGLYMCRLRKDSPSDLENPVLNTLFYYARNDEDAKSEAIPRTLDWILDISERESDELQDIKQQLLSYYHGDPLIRDFFTDFTSI